MNTRYFEYIQNLVKISEKFKTYVNNEFSNFDSKLSRAIDKNVLNLNNEVSEANNLFVRTFHTKKQEQISRISLIESSNIIFLMLIFLSKFYSEFSSPIQSVISTLHNNNEINNSFHQKFICQIKNYYSEDINLKGNIVNYNCDIFKNICSLLKIKIFPLKEKTFKLLYETNNSENISFIITDSGDNIFIISSEFTLNKDTKIELIKHFKKG